MIGEEPKESSLKEKDAAPFELGGLKGGKARVEKLTEERSEILRKEIQKLWDNQKESKENAN